MIPLKTEKDILKMRKAGLLTWSAHELVRRIIRVGMTTAELDAEVEKLFERNYAVGMFKGVPGRVPFPAVTCISINEQIVHGIPGDRKIKDGDIVSVDLGCKIDGWCGDSAYSNLVGNVSEEAKKVVKVIAICSGLQSIFSNGEILERGTENGGACLSCWIFVVESFRSWHWSNDARGAPSSKLRYLSCPLRGFPDQAGSNDRD